MNSDTKKHKKVTIRDVLEEHELELMGITESIDGSPINPTRKISEFLNDSGMREMPEYLDIRARYCDKMRDKEERKKYFQEISNFIGRYYSEKVDEYLASQKVV